MNRLAIIWVGRTCLTLVLVTALVGFLVPLAMLGTGDGSVELRIILQALWHSVLLGALGFAFGLVITLGSVVWLVNVLSASRHRARVQHALAMTYVPSLVVALSLKAWTNGSGVWDGLFTILALGFVACGAMMGPALGNAGQLMARYESAGLALGMSRSQVAAHVVAPAVMKGWRGLLRPGLLRTIGGVVVIILLCDSAHWTTLQHLAVGTPQEILSSSPTAWLALLMVSSLSVVLSVFSPEPMRRS